MRVALGVALTVVWLGSAAAQGRKDDDPGPSAPAISTEMQIYGPGTISCATYLNDRSLRINADGWILGFWTGMNRSNPDNHQVGKATDSRGLVGEVALSCRSHPATRLFDMERQLYDRMKADGQ